MVGGSGALDRELLESLRYLVHGLPHERDLGAQTILAQARELLSWRTSIGCAGDPVVGKQTTSARPALTRPSTRTVIRILSLSQRAAAMQLDGGIDLGLALSPPAGSTTN
jgi:hypothetical protein